MNLNPREIVYKALNKIVRRTNWYDSFWGGVTKFWKLNQFNLEVVNLGSNSGKHAFVYDETGAKGMNWAVGPQSLQYDFSILRNYFSFLKEGAHVVITICPFSCLETKYSKDQIFKYYTFLHPATIDGFDESERLRALKIKANPSKEMPLQCIKMTLREILSRCGRKIKYKKKTDLKTSALEYLELWKNRFGIADLDDPISEENLRGKAIRVQVLNQMIRFCIERDLKPAIVIPPVSAHLRRHLTKGFMDTYINSFISEANSYDIPVYNYIDTPVLTDDKYYLDALFLNEFGAKTFTKLIVSKLEE